MSKNESLLGRMLQVVLPTPEPVEGLKSKKATVLRVETSQVARIVSKFKRSGYGSTDHNSNYIMTVPSPSGKCGLPSFCVAVGSLWTQIYFLLLSPSGFVTVIYIGWM